MSLKQAANACWRYANGLIAAELSRITRYCDRLVQLRPRPYDEGLLLSLTEAPRKESAEACEPPAEEARVLLLNGNANYDTDIQATLAELRASLTRRCRVILVTYNPYLRGLYWLLNQLGWRRDELPGTYVTRAGLTCLSRLAGFEIVRRRPVCLLPIQLGWLSALVNRLFALDDLLGRMAVAEITVLRPIVPEAGTPSVSVIIPARNEKGNIAPALERLKQLEGIPMEVIFVEGHSTDGTWEEIQRCLDTPGITVRAVRQPGTGKSDAVRAGFEVARNDLLAILDADLTMPPELLPRFYRAYCDGLADFINGNRLVYPMESRAMRFLNRIGNGFFARLLSFLLQIDIGDSLCGTKLMSRRDYRRFKAWQRDFGNFDPFGDFELLFPAAALGIGVHDVPIRYRDRTYGATNISRFYHGWLLLRMAAVGLLRIRLGEVAIDPTR